MTDEGKETAGRCEDYEILMMGYLDGELDAEEEERFRSHVFQCPRCAEELAKYQKLAEITDSLKLKEPADYEWERIYGSISYKIETRFGWLLILAGTLTVAGYLLYEVFMDWEVAAWLRVGIVLFLVGFAVLAASAVQHRLRIKKYERYGAVKR
jgi:hypothetical protein